MSLFFFCPVLFLFVVPYNAADVTLRRSRQSKLFLLNEVLTLRLLRIFHPVGEIRRRGQAVAV